MFFRRYPNIGITLVVAIIGVVIYLLPIGGGAKFGLGCCLIMGVHALQTSGWYEKINKEKERYRREWLDKKYAKIHQRYSR